MGRVIHFDIQADNVDRAKKFYEKVFGWKITQLMKKGEGPMDYWGVNTGDTNPGINGGLAERGKDKFYQFSCTIEVRDIEKAMKAVKESGGTIIMPKNEIPHVGFFSRVKDTEGNEFGLMQPTEWKPK